MARMRWMRSTDTGELVAVCPRCDTEVSAQPMQTAYCYCRSGAPETVVVQDLAPTGSQRAA